MKIEELRKTHEAATKGPWWTWNGRGLYSNGHEGLGIDTEDMDNWAFEDCDRLYQDMEFIAQARNHFEALLEVAATAKALAACWTADDLLDYTICSDVVEALEKLEEIE